jgi:hypothetical protein
MYAEFSDIFYELQWHIILHAYHELFVICSQIENKIQISCGELDVLYWIKKSSLEKVRTFLRSIITQHSKAIHQMAIISLSTHKLAHWY